MSKRPMKLFLVKRTEPIECIEDDYNAFVIRAENEDECLHIISEFINDSWMEDKYFRKDNS